MPHLTAREFIRWRRLMKFSQPEAAEVLGLSTRTISTYETGVNQNGAPTKIPKSVALACLAISDGRITTEQESQAAINRLRAVPPALPQLAGR